MLTNVFIDSCAWNYLFNKNSDLEKELPASRFNILITREVELELIAIPDFGSDKSDKKQLKNYILQNVKNRPVKTSYTFGFATLEPDGRLSPTQVYGGFNVGTFQSKEERDFYERQDIRQQLQSGKKTKSGLGKNEADASIAAKSIINVTLTNEKMRKNGPLKTAYKNNGRVVYLEEQVMPSGLTIGEYIDSLEA